MLNKKILLIITGSIAAYKALYCIRLLKDSGAMINVIMTESAKKFITPLSVSALTENKVYDNLFHLTDEIEMGHISLAKIHDLIIVMPASGNFIAKVAGGLADDLATTVLLASKTKVLFAPAMNVNMLENKITQKNINYLKKLGHYFIFGISGKLACGDYGAGRIADPENILDFLSFNVFNNKNLDGVDAVVTAGPTKEPLDPIRFISNNSSGIQGYLIAKELADCGAKVTLVSGPTDLSPPQNLFNFTSVKTAEEMYKVCLEVIPKDLFISVAAVTDWKVKISDNKIKKGKVPPNLKLVKNPDILRSISIHKKRPKLVIGFAAETEKLEENALKKIKQKKCDIIIANNVSEKNQVFGSKTNEVSLINSKGAFLKLKKMNKEKIAKKIINEAILPFLK